MKRILSSLLIVSVVSAAFISAQVCASSETVSAQGAQDEEFVLDTEDAPFTEDEPVSGSYDKYVELAEYRGQTVLVSKDTSAEDGMTVNIDVSCSVDSEKIDSLTVTNYNYIIGSGDLIPGFGDVLIGHRQGDRFRSSLEIPEDYFDSSCAGEKADFEITVNNIYAVLPEVALAAVIHDSHVISYPVSLYDEWSSVYSGIYALYSDAGIPQGEEAETGTEASDKMMKSQILQSMKEDLVTSAILDSEGIGPDDERYQKALRILLDTYGFKTEDDMVESGYGKSEIRLLVNTKVCCSILEEYSA